MTLENQVVSLDLAKRLKEFGFKQESLFYWQKWTQSDWELNHYSDFNGINKNGQIEVDGLEIMRDIANDTDDACSAYTVAELGEMLPSSYTFEDTTCHITIEKDLNWWTIKYNSKTNNWCEEKNINEADARAKTLIYLKENNLI